MKGQAVVALAPYKVSWERVDIPEPTADDVVIRVTHSWISNGTESSFVRGERIAGDTPRKEGDPSPFPIVPGYQKVGVVESVGENVTDIEVGETVFATVSKVESMFMPVGGHVSPAVTPRHQVWKIPPGVDPIAVSGLVLTQVGYNCGMRAPVSKADRAVVVGDGMVGHWAAQTLAYRGAHVMMIGKHDQRLKLFELRANDRVVNINREDALRAIRDWAPHGVGVVVDTVGSAAFLEAVVPVMKHCGHLVSAGFHGADGHIDIQVLRSRELSLHAPAGWTKERMDATLDLIAKGALTTLPLITQKFPVEKAADAFALINNRREHGEHVLGIILEW